MSTPSPEAAWPVAAKGLLTKRERQLYETLHALYPDHRLFVQVALSQLIDVPRSHPERQSIRARFKQLVADFVLCNPDLSILTVIELDDRSHENPVRQAADARKTKALSDAGLRLLRIPKGPLPSAESLQRLINEFAIATPLPSTTVDGQLDLSGTNGRLAVDWGSASISTPADVPGLFPKRVTRTAVMRIALAAAIIGCWFAYMSLMPHVVQYAFSPSAVKASAVSPVLTRMPPSVVPVKASVSPPAPGPTKEAIEERRDLETQAIRELKRQKDLAWNAYYTAPPSCDHPADWTAQVECGNQYIRAKRTFDKQWARDHGPQGSTAASVALDNQSIRR